VAACTAEISLTLIHDVVRACVCVCVGSNLRHGGAQYFIARGHFYVGDVIFVSFFIFLSAISDDLLSGAAFSVDPLQHARLPASLPACQTASKQ